MFTKMADLNKIEGGKIYTGTSANEPAVLGNMLTTFMTTIIAIFNAHTHNYQGSPSTPTPTSIPNALMTLTNFLSKKNLVE